MLKRDGQTSDDGRQIQSLAPVQLWSWNSDGHRRRLRSNERQNCRDKEDIYQSDLEEEKPAEAHQLVITKSGQGPSHPHENENDDGDLCEEDRDVYQTEDPPVRAIGNSREMPAAEE